MTETVLTPKQSSALCEAQELIQRDYEGVHRNYTEGISDAQRDYYKRLYDAGINEKQFPPPAP